MSDVNQGSRARPEGEGMDRRRLLQLGAAGALGLTLPGVVEAREAWPARGRRNCILLFMNGGPSHIDTWDPKPDAPAEYRGEFNAIPTTVAGLQVSEHLPRMARLAHHYSVLRGVTGSEGSHERACRHMLTGCVPSPGKRHPSLASLVAHGGRTGRDVPPYVAIPHALRDGGPGRLGSDGEPLAAGDPASGDYMPPRGSWNDSFELDREPLAIAERYGTSSIGRSCLLARRLVERGTRFVTIADTGWDTHGNNFKRLASDLLPPLDRAFSALIEDLHQRGLLADTLVVWMGEFGRTPKINRSGGRDHWPHAQSVVVAGGGVGGGQVIGSTDVTGSFPASRAATPSDVISTLAAALGAGSSGTRLAQRGSLIPELIA